MHTGDVLRFAYGIQAPLHVIYRAFTNAIGLEEWLCQVALADPRPGGYIFLGWESGYFAAGEFKSLETDRSVVFTWHGKGEPAISEVQVTLTQQTDDVMVVIEHRGLGIDDQWQNTRRQVEKGWIIGLENLIARMEEGIDRRISDRPMMGLALEEATPHHKTPSGLRVTDVLLGMSAAQAGLLKGDVLTEIDGQPIPDYPSFGRIISRHRAGDILALVLYREDQKQEINLTLMRRPMAEIAATPVALLQNAREIYVKNDAALLAVLKGVTEKEAAHLPAPGEWSVRDVLAHMLHVERDFHTMIIAAILSQTFNFADNFPARIQATLEVYPTVQDLLGAFFTAEKETLALFASLPESFTARSASFWNLAYNFPFFADHTFTHLEQIRAALAAARSA